MNFAWPAMLFLALPAAAGAVLQWRLARRPGAGTALPAVVRAVASGGRIRAGVRASRQPWRFWTGLLLLVVALARPQWGTKPDGPDRRPEVMIAIDLSRSMLATDALPSRLERARAIARHFVDQSPGADIGLIAFAGQAYALAAPSPDRALLHTFLPVIAPDQMVVPGSNYASLLTTALTSFGDKAPGRTLVILSDGEAEPTPWRPLLPRLRAAGIHVVTVGLGSAAGAHIRLGRGELKDAAGTAVTTRLEADALREIAHGTQGRYLSADRSGELAASVAAIGEAATAAARPSLSAGQSRQDRFGWFLAPALLLLLWSAAGEWPALPRLLRRRRKNWMQPAAYLSGTLLAVTVVAPGGQAVKPPPITLELHGTEPDPLLVVKDVTRRLLGKPIPTAADYMALAQAAVRYGEVHRQHAHVLQEGVMRDGLVAIDAGRALDPHLAGWNEARAKLIRLLRPPRPIDKPGKDKADPANDPIDAKLNMPVPVPSEDEGKEGRDSGKRADQGDRKVGGAQRSKAEEAEWRVPSLVKPLYALQKVRDADRPGELFRLMQLQQPLPSRRSNQTW